MRLRGDGPWLRRVWSARCGGGDSTLVGIVPSVAWWVDCVSFTRGLAEDDQSVLAGLFQARAGLISCLEGLTYVVEGLSGGGALNLVRSSLSAFAFPDGVHKTTG